MEWFDLATELLQLNELENSVFYVLIDESISKLNFRFGSLESLQPLTDSCIIPPGQEYLKGKVRVEFQDLNSSGTTILYPDGWGPYKIKRTNGKLVIQKIKNLTTELTNEAHSYELKFGEYSIPLSIKWIRNLTPFQFCQNRSK